MCIRPLGYLIGAVLLTSGCADDPSTSPAITVALVTDNPFRIGRPLVIPHAGGDGMYPENTMFAYGHSMAAGGDVVDIDVRLANDGVLVAIHDPTVDRTTNGSGSVAEMSSTELAGLDAGWAFERDGAHPFRGLGIGVPTVEEVLRAFPDHLATLDLKDQRVAVVAPVCDLLGELDRSNPGRSARIYVGVDTDEQVEAFRRDCPQVHTSGTSAERQASRRARESGDPTFVTDQLVSQPGYYSDDGTPRVTAETLAFSHEHDIAVLTYVVDNPDDMVTLIELGVDGIYTRRPDVLVDLLR